MGSLPPFTPEDPAHWLKLVDAHFKLKKIESPPEKIYSILMSLTYELQRELDGALTYTDEEQYKSFKQEVLAATALPAQKRIDKLIASEELGDQKPSVFLRHLKTLAGSQSENEEFIKTLFLKRLPPSISQILASMPQSSVDELAKSADAIICYQQTNAVGSISAYSAAKRHEPKHENFEDQLRFIRNSIANLADQIKDLTMRVQNLESAASYNRGRSYNRNYRSSSRQKYGANNNGMCYYHVKFGSKANRCTKPCTYDETPK